MIAHSITSKLALLLRLAIAIAVTVVLSSCSSSVTIMAERFSGVVLDTTMMVEVGTIMGDDAFEFKRELVNRIQSAGGLKFVPAAEVAPGSSAILVIEGTYRPFASEEFTDVDVSGKKERHRITTYKVGFDYRITEKMTNELIVSGYVEEQKTESQKVEDEGFFASIMSSLVEGFWKSVFGIDDYRKLRENVIRRFIWEISPHEVRVEVKLFNDSDMPELETGIGYARAGRWKNALEVFLDAIDKYPAHKKIHKAYYNAGVAYEYDHQYGFAKEFLERAVTMSDEEEYRNELWRCRRYEHEYNWREGYLEKLRMREGKVE